MGCPRVPPINAIIRFLRASKYLCLQREAAISHSAVNRRLVGPRRNWTVVTAKALTDSATAWRLTGGCRRNPRATAQSSREIAR